MLKPYCEIWLFNQERGYYFNYCQRITIESSWELQTDKAKIILPNKFVKDNESAVLNIERGWGVKIFLGYYPDIIRERFEGYVTKIRPGNPLTIFCQDQNWKLKQNVIRGFKSENDTLQGLVSNLWEQSGLKRKIEYKTQQTSSLGKIRYKNGTWSVSEILFNLRDYGVYSFFYNGKLYVGLPNTIIDDRNEYNFIFNGENATILNDSLEWQDVRDSKIVIEAESLSIGKNKRIKKYAYYDKEGKEKVSDSKVDGNVVSRKYINMNETELEKTARRQLNLYNYTGFKGNIQTLGIYPVRTGDIANLIDKKFKDKEGRYYIRTVKDNFSVKDGYKIDLQIDRKL